MMRHLTPERRALLANFIRFGIVGASGVPVETAVVYAVKGTVGLYGAGVVAYLITASWTFTFNRLWTFAGRGRGPIWRLWLAFLGANLSGMVFNRGTYFGLVAFSAVCRDYPVLAVCAGAIAGMFANFVASRRLVFREAK